MKIGEAAAASGVNAKMIRHYEAIGLLRPAERRDNAYRDYGERDIHELRFIRRARRLGFSIAEIGALLALWRDRARPSREVKRIAEAHIGDLDARIADMQAVAETLRQLVHRCHGDDRPDCPILDDLGHGQTGWPLALRSSCEAAGAKRATRGASPNSDQIVCAFLFNRTKNGRGPSRSALKTAIFPLGSWRNRKALTQGNPLISLTESASRLRFSIDTT